MYLPIREHSIIGNLRSAVLVGKNGTIDWAPMPFIDSPSVFGSILDDKKGGEWSICPSSAYTSHQAYIPDTNVLVTTFTTDTGVLELTDFIPRENGAAEMPTQKNARLEIHRSVRCVSGSCDVSVLFAPRFRYARGSTRIKKSSHGLNAANGKEFVHLHASVRHEITKQGGTAHFQLRSGESEIFVLRYNNSDPIDHLEQYHTTRFEEIKQFWKDWVHSCELTVCPINRRWHEIVTRSSLVLKILFFEPIGTIAAAATTSLPEEVGGIRNWDYRFTWIRDSSFTLQALFWLGYINEGERYVNWMIHQCSIEKAEDLQIMYGLRGERDLREEFLTHLEGYQQSKPVRIGNGAYCQEQWDIYGSVLDMVWRLHLLKGGDAVSVDTWRILRSFANYVLKIWREPDEGLWEVRGGKSHFVYSKIMCWVALDRAIKIARAYDFEGETERWASEKDEIRKEVLEHGWSEKKQAFTQKFDSEGLDAALLLMPVLGFLDGRNPKMISTVDAIERELSRGDGLLLRYASNDGLPGQEGVFLLASFWLVDAYVFAGRQKRAEALYERLIGYANETGLFSEEMHPDTNEFLGNFPQAFTHIGLINSSFYLSHRDDTPVADDGLIARIFKKLSDGKNGV